MTLGRNYLILELQRRGLSRRQARRILDHVFRTMSSALASGEDVELPFGTLTVVSHKRRRQRGWFLNRINTLYKKRNTVTLTQRD